MKKKSQIKFGETIGILIIVYLVLVAGFMWYNKVNANNINDIYQKDKRAQAFEKYYFIVNLDMLHVSQRGFIDEEFDLNGLRSLNRYSKTDEGGEYLRKRLGEATITVEIFNHTNLRNSSETIILYNVSYDSNVANELLGVESFKTIIPIVDKTNSKHHIGLLEVKVPTRG